MALTPDDIRLIEATVKNAVREEVPSVVQAVLVHNGFEEDQIANQRTMAFAREMQSAKTIVQKHSLTTLIGLAVTGLVTVVVLGLKAKLGIGQ